MPQRLTKSRFKLGCECPTKLFYAANPKRYPSTKENPFLESLAEGGYQVGELAKLAFPEGVEVQTLDEADALAQTASLLAEPNATVFEAAIGIPDENLLIRVDVLKKTGTSFRLVEVKAKSFDPDEDDFWAKRGGKLSASWLPYLLDVAFQTWVLRRAHPGANVTSSLLLANKRAVSTVDGIHQRFLARKALDAATGRMRLRCEVAPGTTAESVGAPLLIERCVDAEVNHLLQDWRDAEGRTFTELARLFAEACATDTRLPSTLGAACKGCEFRPEPAALGSGQASGLVECWSERTLLPAERLMREPLVIDLWNDRKTGERIADGCYLLRDVDDQALVAGVDDTESTGLSRPARQALQVRKVRDADASAYVDAAGLRSEIAGLVYPLHFIDFETAGVALPFTAGRRPYETHAFQFSYHVMHEDGRVVHHGQYLDVDRGGFPNVRFVRALAQSLGDAGGTFVHYAPHENSVLGAVRRQLLDDPGLAPDADGLVRFLESITTPGQKSPDPWQPSRPRVDLLAWVKRYYYHPRTGGSNSIKAVLPAVLASSPLLEQRYGTPTYGTPAGIRSLNFTGMQWFERDAAGEVRNPYDKLPPLFPDVATFGEDEDRLLRHDVIKEGGAAMTAYARLQYEVMSDAERAAIRAALLKYCELDTLAMVMVFEHLRALADEGGSVRSR